MKLRISAAVIACAFLALSIQAAEADCDENSGRCPPGQQTYSYSPRASAGTWQSGHIVGGRPVGCPQRFCGCEASLYLFGKIKPELNLAANWMRFFPRTSPAPRMVAARRGHVMVLIEHRGGDKWLVHDGNSGGGKTRRHVRSIRGFVVVDPRGGKVVMR